MALITSDALMRNLDGIQVPVHLSLHCNEGLDQSIDVHLHTMGNCKKLKVSKNKLSGNFLAKLAVPNEAQEVQTYQESRRKPQSKM